MIASAMSLTALVGAESAPDVPRQLRDILLHPAHRHQRSSSGPWPPAARHAPAAGGAAGEDRRVRRPGPHGGQRSDGAAQLDYSSVLRMTANSAFASIASDSALASERRQALTAGRSARVPISNVISEMTAKRGTLGA